MAQDTGKQFLVLGRAGLDLYPDPAGTRIDEALTFQSALGGSSGNIAAGLARAGANVGLLTKVSKDAVGEYTLAQCRHYGIATDYVSKTKGEERTTLALSELRMDSPQTVIYRNDAADFSLSIDDVNSVDWTTIRGLIFTGTSLAKDPSRSATFRAMERAREAGATILFDVDYRAYSWSSLDEAASVCTKASLMSDYVIGNDDEFGVLAGAYDEGLDFAEKLATENGKITVYKMGERGSVCFSNNSRFETGIFPVSPMKPTGAGDAFMANFAHALSQNVALQDAIIKGSAAAALVVKKVGCAPAMPTGQELDAFMNSHNLTDFG